MWNYLDIFGLDNFPNFKHIIENGVKAEYLQNLFATKTFPNHFSIVSGQYEEIHGIVHNNMYDPKLKEVFKMGNTLTEWWDAGGEPIWVTNQNFITTNNSTCFHKSNVIMWPGCDVKIKGIYPSFYTKYSKITLDQKFDMILSAFSTQKDNINLGILYHNQPDEAGHMFGPKSQEVFNVIKDLDRSLGYLIAQMIKLKLNDLLNIIITSDHGMTNTSFNKSVILSDYFNLKDYIVSGSSPVWNIFSNNTQKIDMLYNKLYKANVPQMLIYKKKDIPLKFRYKNNGRIGDLILLGQPGWNLVRTKTDLELFFKGNHGYDNVFPDSWPIFIAIGPVFKKGYKSPPLNNVDIYELMCEILGIIPAPNNGSLANIKHILINDKSPHVDFSNVDAKSETLLKIDYYQYTSPENQTSGIFSQVTSNRLNGFGKFHYILLVGSFLALVIILTSGFVLVLYKCSHPNWRSRHMRSSYFNYYQANSLIDDLTPIDKDSESLAEEKRPLCQNQYTTRMSCPVIGITNKNIMGIWNNRFEQEKSARPKLGGKNICLDTSCQNNNINERGIIDDNNLVTFEDNVTKSVSRPKNVRSSKDSDFTSVPIFALPLLQ
ncbi:unnamed protein product [Gordionus sp. m RMFG-2023]